MNVLTFPVYEGLREAWPTPSKHTDERLRVVPCREVRAECLPKTPVDFDFTLPVFQRLTSALDAWRLELLVEAENGARGTKTALLAETNRVMSWLDVATQDAHVLMGLFLFDPEVLVQALFAEQQVAPQLPWKFKDEKEAQGVKKYTKSAASRYREIEGKVLGHRGGQHLTVKEGRIHRLISSKGLLRTARSPLNGELRHYFVMETKAAKAYQEAAILVRDLSFYAGLLDRLLVTMEETRKEILDGERRRLSRELICQRYRSLLQEASSLRLQMKLRREAIPHALLRGWKFLCVGREQRDRKQAKGREAILGSMAYGSFLPAANRLDIKDRTLPNALEFVRDGSICLVQTGDVHAKGFTLWIELL